MTTQITLEKLNIKEALRYLGYGQAEPDEKTKALLSECEALVQKEAMVRYVYKVVGFTRTDAGIKINDTNLCLTGNSIREHLLGCQQAVLMAVTISSGIDRLLRVLQLSDMAKAVVADSLASVAVEQACDKVETLIRAAYPAYYQTFRFGLGYGDLPIHLQADFLKVLNAPKQIGLNVSTSSMLVPTKSVTAVIGLSNQPVAAKARGCQTCSMHDTCKFREKGGHCNG